MWFLFNRYDCGADGQYETKEGQVRNCVYTFWCPGCKNITLIISNNFNYIKFLLSVIQPKYNGFESVNDATMHSRKKLTANLSHISRQRNLTDYTWLVKKRWAATRNRTDYKRKILTLWDPAGSVVLTLNLLGLFYTTVYVYTRRIEKNYQYLNL